MQIFDLQLQLLLR